MYRNIFELKRPFPLKVYLILIGLTLITNILVQPYQLALQGISYDPEMAGSLLRSVFINTVIYSVFGGLGLFLATRVGFGLPFFENIFPPGERWPRFARVLIFSVVVGVGVSVLVLGVDQLIFKKLVLNDLVSQGMNLESQQAIQPAWWQALMASFYGGISEEIQLRLFLLTLLAWVGSRIWRDPEGRPGLGLLWVATVLSALIFGFGHLPTLSASLSAMGLSLTPVLIASTLTLNGVGGIVFGWLFWSRGLESAMIAHFAADILVHVILPAILN